MFVYLVRHGEAREGTDDASRTLTAQGEAEIKKVAVFASWYGIAVDEIMHSEKTRARQTAEIIAGHLQPARGITEEGGLAPGDDPADWERRLSSMHHDIMLVGHLPHLARLSSALVCGTPDGNIIDFKAGGILCLKRSPDLRWRVAWAVMPEALP